ncbi:MAG: MBL fold metallo-hydrolase [Clostridiales bacterium]|nr:MBL fold metallo-hydrolase [Clostridiales bacterium]
MAANNKGRRVLPLVATALLALAIWYGTQRDPAGPADISGWDGEGLLAVFIDVGQGACVLVGDGDDWLLVDAGPPEAGDDVVAELRRRGVDSLSIVVATHPHSDHIGGLPDVLASFAVDALYMPRAVHDTPTFDALMDAIEEKDIDIHAPRPGQTAALAGMRARFLHPPEDARYSDYNEYSVVVRVESEWGDLLITGDMTDDVERDLLGEGFPLTADILQVPHHGSDTSSSAAFLEAVYPRYAVVQCGLDNSYGHPHTRVLARLEKLSVQLFRTDRDGTVVFTLTDDGIGVSAGR